MPKKNGFCVYMDERRPGILAAGHVLVRGRHDLAELVSEDWKALSEKEKAKYHEQAKQFNERAATKKQPKNGESTASLQKPLIKKDDSDELLDKDKRVMDELRSKVFKMFEKPDWINQPIIICNFSAYFEPEYCDDVYIPAEIGLTAMTLKDGVIDNFARITDPGTIPKGHEEDAAQMAKKLGIPAPGTCPGFDDYRELMHTVESFLDLHKGNLTGTTGEYFVFAFDSDYKVFSRCLEWLLEKIEYRFSVKVLSLDVYTFLGSSQKIAFAVPENFASQVLELANTQSIIATISPFRSVGNALTKSFIYPADYPMTTLGLFFRESDVDSVIKQVDNYKYYEELCCVYHLKSGKETQNCALNISNRYAYSILEILTLSNSVPIVAGGHYPEIDDPVVEKTRRYFWLRRWGLTSLEVNMEEFSQESVLQVGGKDAKFKEWKGQYKCAETAGVQKTLSSNGKKGKVKGLQTLIGTLGEVTEQANPETPQHQTKNHEPTYSYGALQEDENGCPHPYSGDVPLFFRTGFSGSK